MCTRMHAYFHMNLKRVLTDIILNNNRNKTEKKLWKVRMELY